MERGLWFLVWTINMVRSRIIWETNLWACPWGIIFIALIVVERPSHCGWHHSPTPTPARVRRKENREHYAPRPLNPGHGYDMTSCFKMWLPWDFFAKTKHNLELGAKQVISLLNSSYWGMLSQQWKKKQRWIPGPSWGSRICWTVEDSEWGLERVRLGSKGKSRPRVGWNDERKGGAANVTGTVS